MKQPRQWHNADAHIQLRAEADLPEGVAGRVTGIALTYNVVDSYGTLFARGCAKRSVDTKVAARKVPLLMDHERVTGAHVGVVATMSEVGDALMMTADLFDTPSGRAALEYCKAVIAAGASTGFSIGFVPRRSEVITVDGQVVEKFTEIELREVSITPMPAVPGADVMGARNDADEMVRSDVDLLTVAADAALNALPVDVRDALLSKYLPAPPASDSATRSVAPAATGTATAPATATVSLEQRVAAVRQTYL